jgi:hypothetical protein
MLTAKLPGGSAVVVGDVLSAKAEAAAIELQLRDGKTVRVPLIRVSAPINAAFFHEILCNKSASRSTGLRPGRQRTFRNTESPARSVRRLDRPSLRKPALAQALAPDALIHLHDDHGRWFSSS